MPIDGKRSADHENVIILHFWLTADFILIFKSLKCKFLAQKFKIESRHFIFWNQHNFLNFREFFENFLKMFKFFA